MSVPPPEEVLSYDKIMAKVREECRRYGIPEPCIIWVEHVKNGKEKLACYFIGTPVIYVSLTAFREAYRLMWPFRDLLDEDFARAIFHELKHYIDSKVFGVSEEEYLRNKEYYEREAQKYASKMVKEIFRR